MSIFDQTKEKKVLSPQTFAHVVLRTNDIKPLRDFYVSFLGGRIAHENEFAAFITYDQEHHRIALLEVPNTKPRANTSCGLEHIAYSFSTLTDLLLAYRQRRSIGIEPFWCVNHGPTTSIYYKDPDGNAIETQVDNFATAEEADVFMKSKYFEENAIGVDFDPEEMIRRIEQGEKEDDLKKRVEIGPRALTLEVIA